MTYGNEIQRDPCEHTIVDVVHEKVCQSVGGCGQKAGQVQAVTWERITLFAYEKRARALQMYEETHSVTETIRVLGYPGRQTLYKWISKQNQPKMVKSPYRGENTETHPRHPPVKLKLEVLHRCFELGEDAFIVSYSA